MPSPSDLAPRGDELDGRATLERIAQIARRLSETDGLDRTLQAIVDVAQESVGHCDGATLMLLDRGGRVSTPAATSTDAMEADRAQHRTREGPCLSAMHHEQTVVVDDLDDEERWPRWRAEVLGLGWRSTLGLRLFIAQDTMGALNLYSRRPAGFTSSGQALGQILASHAAVALKAAITEAGLERALSSRDVIGQAKGILMERGRLTGEQAFERLSEVSQRRNERLAAVAGELVRSGELPD